MMMLVTVSLIVLALVSSSLAYREVGCFKDKPERILEGKFTSSDCMTIDKCVKTCSDLGHYFAALEYSRQCFCGKYFKQYQNLNDKDCSTPCSGDSNQICGGTWKASVYTTDVGPAYLGCYVDKRDRILEGAMKVSKRMTPKYCINLCKKQGKRFAMTEYGKECFCGNHLKNYAKKPDSECNYKCKGDNSKMCGGFWRGSLYLLN